MKKLSAMFLLSFLTAALLFTNAYAARVSLGPSGGDDTAAINAAIARSASSGGGVVSLSSGVYRTSGLALESNVTLEGEGRGATVLKHASGGCAISIRGTEQKPLHDVIVRSLGIKGPGKAMKGQSGICMADALRGVIIESVEITGMGEDAVVSSGNVFGLKIADSRLAFNTHGRGLVLSRTKYRTNAARVENVEVWGNAGGILIDNAFNDVLRGVWLENNLGVYPDVQIKDSFGCGMVESYVERNKPGSPVVRIEDSVTTFVERNIITSSAAGAVISEAGSTGTTVTGNRLKGRGDLIDMKGPVDRSNAIYAR